MTKSKIGWEVNELRAYDMDGVETTYLVPYSSNHHGTNDPSNVMDSDLSTYWEANWDVRNEKHYLVLTLSDILSRLRLYQSNQLQQKVIVEIIGIKCTKHN